MQCTATRAGLLCNTHSAAAARNAPMLHPKAVVGDMHALCLCSARWRAGPDGGAHARGACVFREAAVGAAASMCWVRVCVPWCRRVRLGGQSASKALADRQTGGEERCRGRRRSQVVTVGRKASHSKEIWSVRLGGQSASKALADRQTGGEERCRGRRRRQVVAVGRKASHGKEIWNCARVCG
jgi:hypothetical protein